MKLWILFCASVSLTWFATAQTATTDLDQVVATVNGQPILERDLRQEALSVGFFAGYRGLCPKFSEWSNLQTQAARVLFADLQARDLALGTALKDIAIDDALVTASAKSFQDSFKTFPAPLADYLKCTSDTFEQMKKRARFSLALEEKARLIKESVNVTDSELEQYFSAYQVRYTLPKRIVARMIVLPNRKLAAEVYVAAKKGADFAVLAGKYSILGKTKNGALGAISGSTEPKPIAVKDLGEFPKNLISDAFILVRGGMTRVVSANQKHYIIKVSQYLAPKTQTLNDIRVQVEKDAKATKAKGLMEEWRKSVLDQAQTRFTEGNFDPVVARVNNQEIHFSSMLFFFDVFYNLDQERISQRLNDKIKQIIPQQSLTNEGFQALGNAEDRLDTFLKSQANLVAVNENDAKVYYRTNIKQFQESARGNDVTYLFKRKDLAEAFQKAAFNLGDVPKTPKSDMKLEFDFYNPDILQTATRSSKNTEMYVSSVSEFDTRWAITLTFFPVPAYTKSFESVKDLITQKLLKKKRDEAGQRWIKQQLANAKIENLLEDAIKILEQRSARW